MAKDRHIEENASISVSQNDVGTCGDTNTSLDGYYSTRLNLTGDIESDIEKLYKFFLEFMYDKADPQIVRDTLHEYVRLFNARGLCGAEVVAEKISMVGRKSSKDKKSLNYLVGCFRYVLEHGISATGSFVERRLINAFERQYGLQLSPNGVQRLLTLATSNATLEVLLTIMETPLDLEELLFKEFEINLKQKKKELN